MIDNTDITQLIEAQLHYKSNSKENSFYKIYRNSNVIYQIRISNHGTYLRTWIDKDYDPSISTNISIVFTQNGVPTNDCFIDAQTNKPFTDCTPCIDQQTRTQIPCKSRQVTGISNKKRTFVVKQFIYNCEYLDIEDVPILVQAIKQVYLKGIYNDPFVKIKNKAANPADLTPVESVNDSIIPRNNIIKEYKQNNCNRNMRNKNIVRLNEEEFNQLITESVYEYLIENAEDEGLLGGLGAVGKAAWNGIKGAWNKGKQAAQNMANQVKTTYQQGSMAQDNRQIAQQLEQWINAGVFNNPRAKNLASQLVNMLEQSYQQRFGQASGNQNQFAKQQPQQAQQQPQQQ